MRLQNNTFAYFLPHALIVWWAAANLFYANRFEYYDITTAIVFFVCVFLLFAALTALVMALRPDSKAKVAIVSYALLAVMFLTPSIREILDPYIRYRYTLVLVFLLFVIISLVAVRLLAEKKFVGMAALFFLMLSLAPTGQYILFLATVDEAEQAEPVPLKGAAVMRPNVYFILLDAYMRADTLKDNLGFDNSPFINALGEKKFFVVNQSYVAYPTTTYSIATTFRMQHTTRFDPKIMSYRFKGDTFKNFRELGYRNYFMPDFRAVAPCPEDVTCFNDKERSDRITIGYLGMTLIKTIPLLEDLLLAVAPDRFYYQINELSDLRQYLETFKPSEPAFLYAHVSMPHPPYFRDENCQDNGYVGGKEEEFGTFYWKVRQRYIDFLRCGNRQAIKVVDTIIDNDPEAIIILQSDHGTYFTNNRYTGGKEAPAPGNEPWKEAAMKEAYGNLNALRTPQSCRDMLYPSMSPVNTFRFVFACITGTKPDYLADLSFWIDYKNQRMELVRKNGDWLF